MYIDSRINYQSHNDINIEIDFVNVIAIEISKEELNPNLNIILITLYRPPNMHIKLFTDKLTDLLHDLSKENTLNNLSWTNILGGNVETTYTSFICKLSRKS